MQKSKISSEKINDLKQEIASLSKVERSDIEDMRDIQQRMRDILIQQRTMAISLKVVRSNQKISINGKELNEGQQKKMDENFQLKIGDNVLLADLKIITAILQHRAANNAHISPK